MHNLPLALSSFIGREREIEQVKHLLSESRLVTLTGAGGCGKTRLAIQVATDLVESYIGGVWLIELAPLADPVLVTQATAAALGVREQPGQPMLNSLADYLRSKEVLLLLDNCEHLIGACAQLADALLRACPNLRVLATSREALGLAGETTCTVPSLSLPDVRQRSPTFADLTRYEAVRLFVDRALAVQSSFKLTALNAAAVAQVCQQLDGIPLAIELAAARVKVLKTAEIASRLDDRLNLLTTGSRSALPRHQTLRAAIDWSYDLLTELERVLLRRLAVFAGGWTLEAAESVCSLPEADSIEEAALPPAFRLPRSEILDLLSRLVDKSLVIVDKQGGETRYHMLETIRQYAREKLLELDEVELVQNRHLAFFRHLAEKADPDAHTRHEEESTRLNELEREYDNLLAALDWSLTPKGNSAWGLGLAIALANFWGIRGYFHEGLEYLLAALEQNLSEPTKLRARALESAGWLSYMQGDYPSARAVLDESLAVYRELGPATRRRLASTLVLRGYLESEVGEYVTASGLILQSLDIMRELKDEQGIAGALRDLGGCAVRAGDYAQAFRYLEEALLLFKRNRNAHSTAIVLSGLAEIALRQANYERAITLEQESLTLRRELGDKWGIAVSLSNLAWVSLKQGDLVQTGTLLQESLRLRRGIGDPGGTAWCLEKLAELALIYGERESSARRSEGFRRAARLFGAAAALRSPIGSVIDSVDLSEHERQLGIVRGQLGVTTFEMAWAEGQAMTLGQAIEYALEPSAPREDMPHPSTPHQVEKHEFGGLTARERQVARLIAQGGSNREIAEELVIGERTVESHVANILSKLGFTARTQIAAWAVNKGLVR